MATGYTKAGADLDTLFKGRIGTAASDTGYKVAATDLSQIFEPRGATTAIADTGFKSGGTDLAQIFMDVTAAASAGTITAATSGSDVGWASSLTGGTTFGSLSAGTAAIHGNFTCSSIQRDTGLSNVQIWVHGTLAAPIDADTTWSSVAIVGVFSDSSGATVTRTLTRSARTSFLGGGSNNSVWTFPLSSLQLISGNSYGFTFTHT